MKSFLFKRAQYGKIVFIAFTNKKGCSKFTKYYFNKKKLLTLFQFISKSTFQHRCFSKNWYKRQMEVDVNLTQYHACLRLGVRPSPIWMAAELVNVTVSLWTRSCLVVQVIRQLLWTFFKNVDDCFFSPFFTYMNMYRFVKYLKKTGIQIKSKKKIHVPNHNEILFQRTRSSFNLKIVVDQWTHCQLERTGTSYLRATSYSLREWVSTAGP